jgi:glycerol-3-phosphate O-acyltransferase
MPATQSGAYLPSVYEPSRFWRWVYDQFFHDLQVDAGWADRVRLAATTGHVVYLGRTVSFLDFLALDALSKRHGLPLIGFANDMQMSIVEPFGRGSSRLRARTPLPEAPALAETIRAGAAALLFMRRKPDELALPSPDDDLLRTLVEAQRKTQKPIFLMPQTFVWTKRPPSAKTSLIDVLFGPSEWPGSVRTSLQFIFNYKNAIHRGGEPFNLLTFLQENEDLTDAQAASAIKYALVRRMERERALVLGPAQKTSDRLNEELLRSPRLRAHMERAAKDRSAPIKAIEAEVKKELNQLAAAPDANVIGLFHRVMQFLITRIYDGLVVDQEGFERVREAARRGPLVLVPSHKSHIDYLILSAVFFERGLAVPLIAAGDNLSFFPLGTLFRHSGAFFIRRTFKGNKLYPHIVDAYVRKVLAEGHNLEVFIEGGRSRTGKLLPPKLGILSMVVDAGLKLPETPIQFVPISIGYERLVEEGSYVHELEGGEKKAEDIGGLLRTPKVLRSRYGRLYLQFGEVFELDALRREAVELDAGERARDALEGDLSPSQRRAVVQRIAHRITYEINRVTAVTPASLIATALLTQPKEVASKAEVKRAAEDLVQAFQRFGAPIARTILDREGKLRDDALDGALDLFESARLITRTPSAPDIHVVPARRLALEYFKNNVIHFFVPSALVASALMALGWEAEMTALRERVRLLSRFFKYEFQYRADAEFEDIFSDALGQMIEASEVVWEGDVVRRASTPQGARLENYAEMIRTYIEAYAVVFRFLLESKTPPLNKKEWGTVTLQQARKALASGAIHRQESVSKPKLESALQLLHDEGIVRVSGNDVQPGKHTDGKLLQRWSEVLSEHLKSSRG